MAISSSCFSVGCRASLSGKITPRGQVRFCPVSECFTDGKSSEIAFNFCDCQMFMVCNVDCWLDARGGNRSASSTQSCREKTGKDEREPDSSVILLNSNTDIHMFDACPLAYSAWHVQPSGCLGWILELANTPRNNHFATENLHEAGTDDQVSFNQHYVSPTSIQQNFLQQAQFTLSQLFRDKIQQNKVQNLYVLYSVFKSVCAHSQSPTKDTSGRHRWKQRCCFCSCFLVEGCCVAFLSLCHHTTSIISLWKFIIINHHNNRRRCVAWWKEDVNK